MNKTTLVFFALILSASIGLGQSKSNPAVSTTRIDTIKVPTIQCGSCKSAVEKAVKALDGVTSAKADLKKKFVAVEFVPAKLNLEKIETAITLAGYAANDKKADPEAYEKLDDCCKLPEDQE